jgi:hypothetical protein
MLNTVAASNEERVVCKRVMVSESKRQEGPSCDDSNQQPAAHETIK